MLAKAPGRIGCILVVPPMGYYTNYSNSKDVSTPTDRYNHLAFVVCGKRHRRNSKNASTWGPDTEASPVRKVRGRNTVSGAWYSADAIGT